MKKGWILGLILCLILSITVNPPAAAKSPNLHTAANNNFQTGSSVSSSLTNQTAYNSVYMPQKSPIIPSVQMPSSVQVDVYEELQNFRIPTPYGMAYHDGFIYVAQGNEGLSRISLTTGQIHPIASRDPQKFFRSVAVDTYGDLYYSLKSDLKVRKFVLPPPTAFPISAEQLVNQSRIYTSHYRNDDATGETEISGLAFDSHNELYASIRSSLNDPTARAGLYRKDAQFEYLLGISRFQPEGVTAMGLDPRGNMYFKTNGSPPHYPYLIKGITKLLPIHSKIRLLIPARLSLTFTNQRISMGLSFCQMDVCIRLMAHVSVLHLTIPNRSSLYMDRGIRICFKENHILKKAASWKMKKIKKFRSGSPMS